MPNVVFRRSLFALCVAGANSERKKIEDTSLKFGFYLPVHVPPFFITLTAAQGKANEKGNQKMHVIAFSGHTWASKGNGPLICFDYIYV